MQCFWNGECQYKKYTCKIWDGEKSLGLDFIQKYFVIVSKWDDICWLCQNEMIFPDFHSIVPNIKASVDKFLLKYVPELYFTNTV